MRWLVGVVAVLAVASPAQAATQPGNPKPVLNAVVRQESGIKVRGDKVNWTLGGLIYRNVRHGVFRSSVDPSYYRVDLVPRTVEPYTALVRKRHGKYKVLAWELRYDIPKTLCKRAKPSTPVVLDLGMSTDLLEGKCKHPRDITTLSTPMSDAEIAGIRSLFEPVVDPDTLDVHYTEPDFSEVSSSCLWDGEGEDAVLPAGDVSKADARFGVLWLQCIVGTEYYDGTIYYGQTQLLVSRAGTSGPFTHLLAHVKPDWSIRVDACLQDFAWPIPARARVSLGFCLPFPLALRNFQGPRHL